MQMFEHVDLGTEVHYREVDYGDLEEIIKAYYPVRDVSIVADMEWDNDAKKMLYIEGEYDDAGPWKTKWERYERPSIDQWLNDDPENLPKTYDGNPKEPSAMDFLNELADLGIIYYGEYLVNVSW